MHSVRVRSGRNWKIRRSPSGTDSTKTLRAPTDTNKQIQLMAPEIYRWWWADRSRGGGQAFLENGDLWRGYEGRTLGSILRADADRMDRFRLAIVEDCRRKGPIHSSARIDVAAVVAHVRHSLLRIKIDRRRMTVDNVFRERSLVTKEAVANPKLGFGGLLVEGHARTNPSMNIITEFVFMAGRERTHPFLRSLKRGRRAQRSDGCIAAVGEEVCKVAFRFRRSKHELFVIAPKADSALGLEALDDLKDLVRVCATINIVAEKDQLA